MIIAVDFDGTCVMHEFPKIGEDVPYATTVLKRLQDAGYEIILWTVRSGEYLMEAVKWFDNKGITLWGINENPTQKFWSPSPKAYAEIFIDDAALGCPLIWDAQRSDRPYVDWREIENLLIEKGVLDDTTEDE